MKMEIVKPKLVLGLCPHYSSHIYTEAAWSIMQQVNLYCNAGFIPSPSQSKSLAEIREDLVDLALKTNATHFLWLDGDEIFPIEMGKKLLAMDKDIACAWTMIRQEVHPNVYMCSEATANLDITPHGYKHEVVPLEKIEEYVKSGKHIQKVDRCGFGSVLIKREVFERMPKPWFAFDKYHTTEDLYFFDKAREMGIDTWVDYSQRCLHMSVTKI